MADTTNPQDQIDFVRRLMGSPSQEELSDEVIDVAITTNGSARLAAAAFWDERAAGYAELVNISEAGSSRSQGDLYKNAMAIAANLRKVAGEGTVVTPTSDRPRTRLAQRGA